MSTVENAPQYEQPAIVTNRWIRNGKYPDAAFQNDSAEQTNHLVAWQTKEVFSYDCPLASIPASIATGSTRNRWRFAWHSGPYARYLWVRSVLAPCSQDLTGVVTALPGVRLTVDDGAVTIGTSDWSCGYSAPGLADVPAYFTQGHAPLHDNGTFVEVPPDTDLLRTRDRPRRGRVQSNLRLRGLDGAGHEQRLHPGSVGDGAYLRRRSVSGRGRVARHVEVWGRAPVQLDDGCPEQSPHARVGDLHEHRGHQRHNGLRGEPGGVPRLTNRGRVSNGGAVSVVMKVRAKMSGADVGHVVMKNAAGTELISIEIDSTTEAWFSETALIPSASGKYDFQLQASAGTITLYALSLYQYQA